MHILEIVPYESRPSNSDISDLYDKYARRGGQITVCRACDELLQYCFWQSLDDRSRMCLGRIEVALSRNNYEEAHRAIDYVHRGTGRLNAIETTCADLGMTNRQLNALERNGITHVWQLLGFDRRQLLAMNAIAGPSVDGIIEKLRAFEQKLRDTGEFKSFSLQARELLG